MRKSVVAFLLVLTFVLIFAGISRLAAQGPENGAAGAKNAAPPKPSGQAAPSGQVARGKYIVEDVAYCQNCHTPRHDNGNFDLNHWLQGGPLFWQPAHAQQDYPQLVPRIGGTIPSTDDEMIKLLTTGIWKDGKPLRAPMPQFRLTKEDAQAVVAYLKTVTARQTPGAVQ
ncbi:MAG TPA: cytochrome c [Terriglobales bacterium]|nr:cytochrome c [Terriglobales bacterium]